MGGGPPNPALRRTPVRAGFVRDTSPRPSPMSFGGRARQNPSAFRLSATHSIGLPRAGSACGSGQALTFADGVYRMSYSDFTLAEVRQRLGLSVAEAGDLFADIEAVDLPANLADTLARYLPLALNLNTEKARLRVCRTSSSVLTALSLLNRRTSSGILTSSSSMRIAVVASYTGRACNV